MLWALFCGFAPLAVAGWLCALMEDANNRAAKRDMDRKIAEAMAKWNNYTPTPEDWANFYIPRSYKEERARALWRARASWKINR